VRNDQHERAGSVLDGGTAKTVDVVDAGTALGGADNDDVLAKEGETLGDVEAQVALAVGEVLPLDAGDGNAKLVRQASGERKRGCRGDKDDTHGAVGGT